MSNWQKFKELSPPDRYRLAGYVLQLPLIRIGLKWLGYRRLYAFLAANPRSPTIHSETKKENLQTARHTAYLVSVAARHGLMKATCLHQALLAFWLLRKTGIITQLRIGVKDQQGSILSHAWLVYDGEVLIDDPRVEQDFSVFEDL